MLDIRDSKWIDFVERHVREEIGHDVALLGGHQKKVSPGWMDGSRSKCSGREFGFSRVKYNYLILWSRKPKPK